METAAEVIDSGARWEFRGCSNSRGQGRDFLGPFRYILEENGVQEELSVRAGRSFGEKRGAQEGNDCGRNDHKKPYLPRKKKKRERYAAACQGGGRDARRLEYRPPAV